MQHKEYNGWTNYETWLVNLWLDNDQGSQEHWTERAEELVKDDADEAEASLASELESQHDEQSEELVGNAGVFSDLLSAALSEVNWREIASHYVDTAKESLGVEEDAEEQAEAL